MVQESRLETTSRAVSSPVLQQCSSGTISAVNYFRKENWDPIWSRRPSPQHSNFFNSLRNDWGSSQYFEIHQKFHENPIIIHHSDHAWPSPAPPDTHASSRIFVAQQLQRVEPNHDACHGIGLVRGRTWSQTWALGWSGFHGSSINLSVKYSTLAIPTDSLLYTCKCGMLLDALGKSGKEKSQSMIGGNSKSKATLIA